ncbi:T9SS type A sorting domain-containing protein [bacterium]|nr:T9SS type A sorting domain-containing protein [bacterium]
MSKVIALACLLLISIPDLRANNIIGGETEWQYLGKNTYKLIVNFYWNCNITYPITAAPFDVFMPSCYNQKKLSSTLKFVADVTPVCKKNESKCQNFNSNYPYGFALYQVYAIFQASDFVKSGCCVAEVSWNNCCRSGTISTGGSYSSIILSQELNLCEALSSPTWNQPAIGLGCVGTNHSLDFGVDHSNSCDSVRYTCTNSTQVTWSGSYSSCAPVYFLGFPNANLAWPRGYHIDSLTGLVRFRSLKTEHTIIPVRAEIYENGKYIGFITREMEYIILNCPSNSPPIPSGINLSNPNKTANFEINTCAGKKLCFTVSATDFNEKDSVRLAYFSKLNGLTVKKDTNGLYEQLSFCWQPDSTDISTFPHQISLSAIDNHCPTNGINSQIYKIRVFDTFNYKLAINVSETNHCGDYLLHVSDSMGRKITNIKWYENDTIFLGNMSNQLVSFSSTGSRKITVLVDDCLSQSLSTTINVKYAKPRVNLTDTAVCNNKTLLLVPKVINRKENYSYTWTLQSQYKSIATVSDTALVLDLPALASITNEAIILSITDTLNNCNVSSSFVVKSLPSLLQNKFSSRTFCATDADTLLLGDKPANGVWIGAGIIDNSIHANLLESGSYLYTYSEVNDSICIVDTAIIRISKLSKIEPMPDFELCINDYKPLQHDSILSASWIGNGINNDTFYAVKAGPGVHQLVYSYSDSMGCKLADTIMAKVYNDFQEIIISADTFTACINGTATLFAKPTGGIWMSDSLLSENNPLTVQGSKYGLGFFPFIYEYSNNHNCITRDTAILQVVNTPKGTAVLEQSFVQVGDTLVIKNTTSNKHNYNFYWQSDVAWLPKMNHIDYRTPLYTKGLYNIDLQLITEDKATKCLDTNQISGQILVVPLGINNLSRDLNIYPNPAHATLTIVGKQDALGMVKIYNSSGQLVLSFNCNQSRATIKTETFPAGLYYLTLFTEKGVIKQTFIKE